ncbi:hypothetical protein M9H77_30784 [Catharanthus roseus]|uniref:Uncharacterized protein n=1 Tax=Catharanthus roseus TaxID=4058 RepID=A0ACC0A0V4_CATRO|nr:hypothetical protein M9H77_30784 [Catharanthus roseus]
MEYNWSNPSWKWMEVKSKQESYQSKFTRDMHSFHHGGGNAFNAYGGKDHRNGDFTSKRHIGVDNFSSDDKSFEHTSYNDCGGYGRKFEAQNMEHEGILGYKIYKP